MFLGVLYSHLKKYNTYYVLKNTHDAKEMLLMRLPLNYLLVLE